MWTPIRAAALAAVSSFCFATSLLAAPVAKQYASSLTSPPLATGSTIKITKPSKVSMRVGTGSVTFQLKVSAVTDSMDLPVTLASNTFQIDIQRPNGAVVTQMFFFDITAGKFSGKFPLADSAFQGGALNPGESIEIRAVKLLQAVNGNVFALSGLTIK